MKRIELLAPAGNSEALKAAVAAGCDAVYIGLTSFSARAFAGNFTHEEYIEAVRYCHIHDVKVYVTVNTLMYETEIDHAFNEIRFLYEHDVDGIMIQDLGLFHRAHVCFPDLPLFCSTQMHIHNREGAAFMKKMGASRVVAARETPLSVIKDMISTGIDVEAFAYGALCISYSGQCLMSQAMKNRSGNKGMCAQMCRMKYTVNGKRSPEGDYLLSPRDLNLLERIPELIEAGIVSLKIEGRMKRPEYVYLIIRTFREAIDACLEGRTYHVSEKRMKDLRLMFNREFTEGHIFGAPVAERMNHFRPNHLGVTIGHVREVRRGRVLVELTDTLYQHDGLRILSEPEDIGITAGRIEKNGMLVNEAHRHDRVWLTYGEGRPKPGQKLQKTSDAKLLETIRRDMEVPRRIPVSLEYTAYADAPLTLTVSDGERTVTAVSDEVCEPARSAPLTKERLEKQLKRTGDSAYEVTAVDGTADDVFIPLSVINAVRRNVLNELDDLRALRHAYQGEMPFESPAPKNTAVQERIIVDGEKCTDLPGIRFMGQESLPVVCENGYGVSSVRNAVINETGGLLLEKAHCIAGMNLNTANSWTAAFLLSLEGIDGVIVSSELNDDLLDRMISAFRERYGFTPALWRPVYGRRVLMYIKDGFLPADAAVSTIEDMSGNVYPVRIRNGVTEILEPRPLRKNTGRDYGSYVMITDEDTEESGYIVEGIYEEVYH